MPYTVDNSSKSATPEMRACSGSFDESYTLAAIESGQASLPAFITHDGSGVLTVTPTTSSHMGTWTIEVTQTTTYGDDPVWDAVQITVGCTIATITPDAAPTSGLTYNLYDTPLLIDLSSWAYTQTPPCDYTVVNSFTWTVPSAA